jgi:plastocyanin
MRPKTLLLVSLVAASTLVPGTGRAVQPLTQTDNVFYGQAYAGPAAKFYGYLTPVIVVEKGGELTFTSIDLERHDVVQDVEADGFGGSSKAPWCATGHHHHGHVHEACPVFWSKLIGLTQTTTVLGLDKVEPGKVYSFYCTLHHGMKGKLVVRP